LVFTSENKANTLSFLNLFSLGYNVRYWRKSMDELQNYWERRFPGQRSRAVIIGLEANTEYGVRVFVYTQFGDSPESSYFTHRTFRLPPQTPAQYISVRQPMSEKNKRVRLFSDIYTYKVEVEWRGISTTADEEPLEGYMVKRNFCFQLIRELNLFRLKFGNIINPFVMQRFIMLMVRNINLQLIICIKIVIINYVYKRGLLVVKENIHHRKKNFDLVSFGFFDSLHFLNLFFNLDDEGRLLLRKFICYSMIFPDLLSLILVYNPDTSLRYFNIASKHYSFLTVLFILLSFYFLCR
jgi:hypothetical protein